MQRCPSTQTEEPEHQANCTEAVPTGLGMLRSRYRQRYLHAADTHSPGGLPTVLGLEQSGILAGRIPDTELPHIPVKVTRCMPCGHKAIRAMYGYTATDGRNIYLGYTATDGVNAYRGCTATDGKEVVDMDNILKHLDKAFLFVSDIPVKGDDVEKMAVVRQELREAYSSAKRMKEEENSDG